MADFTLKGFKGLKNLNEIVNSPMSAIPSDQLVSIPLHQIKPGRCQPRRQFSREALEELASSIKTQGVIQPVLLQRLEEGRYELIAGERRWRASQLAGLETIPAIIKSVDEKLILAMSLIENIQRENLNIIDEALAYTSFKEQFEMTHSEIAGMVGRSRVSVTNCMRLLSLDDGVKDLLVCGKLNMGHARALLNLEPVQQRLCAKKIVENGLNVRSAEKLSQRIKEEGESLLDSVKSPTHSTYEERCRDWSKELTKKLSSRVSVKLNDDGVGKILIHVSSAEEVDWLVDNISTNKN